MSLPLAAAEGVGALVLLGLCSQFVAAQLLGLGEGGSGDATGALRLTAVLCAFVLLYAPRFRPALPYLRGAWDVAAAVGTSCRLRLSLSLGLVLALHAAQLGVLAYLHVAASGSSGSLWSCLALRDALVGVVHEEFVYRAALFLVLLHRSGGNIAFAVLGVGTTFVAIHVGNVWGPLALTPLPLLKLGLALVAGLTYALEFAATGSLGNCVAMHAMNNVVALVWMGVGGEGVPGARCADVTAVTPALLASLTAQLAVYCAAGAWSLSRLRGMLHDDVEIAAFRRAHRIVYGGGDGSSGSISSISSGSSSIGVGGGAHKKGE